ncbi:MAG TPA: MBL fold metallo-hydrolase [Spirochaetota bacterium]|nr:MBL fold metallo-hydrolase [Spirochaetota bacterium]
MRESLDLTSRPAIFIRGTLSLLRRVLIVRKRTFVTLAISLLIAYFSFMTTYGTTPFEVYAVRYGTSNFRSEFVYDGDRTRRILPFSWMYYAVKCGRKIILIDTGFSDKKNARIFGVKFTDPTGELVAIGIRPENVTDIILTHAHFDHAGDISRYKNARVFTQISDLKTIRDIVNDDSRVIPFDNALDIDDAIHIEHVGGHTKSSSVVWITLPGKKLLLTGDEAYMRDNITRAIPIGSRYDVEKNRAFLERARDSGTECYTFHDPSIVTGENNVIRIYP